jgi:cytochrome b pre-mRNA-processing protein 3
MRLVQFVQGVRGAHGSIQSIQTINSIRSIQQIPTVQILTRSIHSNSLLRDKVDEKQPLELTADNFVTRLYKKIFRGVPKSKLKASGYILLTHCVQLTQLDKFFRVFDMPDTFYSWFLVTELHVWMLCARLMNEGDYGRIVRNSVVEALWQDCDQRAKSIGDMASSARSKQILQISEEFQAALFVYDEGLLGSDQELANALWRRFFLSMRDSEEKQVPDMEKVALLVDYVRRTMATLDNTDAVTLLMKGQVSWVPLNETINSCS